MKREDRTGQGECLFSVSEGGRGHVTWCDSSHSQREIITQGERQQETNTCNLKAQQPQLLNAWNKTYASYHDESIRKALHRFFHNSPPALCRYTPSESMVRSMILHIKPGASRCTGESYHPYFTYRSSSCPPRHHSYTFSQRSHGYHSTLHSHCQK